jgi:hypothetical protein
MELDNYIEFSMKVGVLNISFIILVSEIINFLGVHN